MDTNNYTIRCTNWGEDAMSYVFGVWEKEKRRAVFFQSFEDGSAVKTVNGKYFSIDQMELVVSTLKDKPNLKLLIKRFKREMKKNGISQY